METLQPNVGAAISITYSAALIAFILRLYARKWTGVPFIPGDWVSAVAFFFVTAFNILYLIKLKFGLGLHCEDIAQHNHDGGIDYDGMTHNYFLLLYPDIWLYTTAIGLSKMTALALYWRMFGRSVTRYWILLLAGCVVWWMFARYVTILAVCHPISRFWNRKGPGRCRVNMAQFFYATTGIPQTWSGQGHANSPAAAHLALEACIVALPWYELRRLNRAKAERIALAAMFSSGIMVCIASLVQLVLATQLNTTSQELWWINTPQAVAAIIEINLAHFSTSLPNLRPVLRCLTSSGSVRTGTLNTEHSTGVWRSSSSHTGAESVIMPAQLGEFGNEGLIAQPKTVVSVKRVTETMPTYDRPFSRTETGPLKHSPLDP